MKSKIYFQVKIELLSPLSIGDSFSESTDRDVIMNSLRNPVIPATSLAGVFRSLETDEENRKKYFGDVVINKTGGISPGTPAIQSALKFFDAKLSGGYNKAVRDGVALTTDKTAIPGAKFDYQVVETGAIFIGYIEADTQGSADYAEEFLEKKISIGSKTTRGFGKVALFYRVKAFDLGTQMDEWLDFDMFDAGAYEGDWAVGHGIESDGVIKIKLELEQKGGLSIRKYLTDPKKGDNDQPPDYGPVSLKDGTPVIPGTSWAGMFKSQVLKLLSDGGCDDIEAAFGFVNDKTSQKSKVTFSESKLSGCSEKTLVRNAIDRFTNGTKEGALYTEKTVYGGKCELEIGIAKTASKRIVCALLAAIVDLNNGFSAVGGLTAVGRGLFLVKHVCIGDRSPEKIEYSLLKEAIES